MAMGVRVPLRVLIHNMDTNEIFICECGRYFKSKSSLKSHYRLCETHQKLKTTNKRVSKYKISDNLYRCECGKEFNNFQSLNAHFSHCDYHHKCLGTERKIRAHEINGSMRWESKTPEEIKEIKKKAGQTLKRRIKNNEIIPSFKGKKHSNESKEKIRNSTIKYLESTIDNCRARYNKTACQFIDNLNKSNNWNLQHAENGGEVILCGYYVDGYDKDLNIVFEYDEPTHYEDIYNNVLKQKDIDRQNYIIEKTNCEFYRYNERLDLLYKI